MLNKRILCACLILVLILCAGCSKPAQNEGEAGTKESASAEAPTSTKEQAASEETASTEALTTADEEQETADTENTPEATQETEPEENAVILENVLLSFKSIRMDKLEDGTIVRKEAPLAFTYDEEGRIISAMTIPYLRDGEYLYYYPLICGVRYEYEDGRLVRGTAITEGDKVGSCELEYDDQGRIVKQTRWGEGPMMPVFITPKGIEYRIEEFARRSTAVGSTINGTPESADILTSSYEYVYDEQGRVAEEKYETFYEDGTLHSSTVHTLVYDEDGMGYSFEHLTLDRVRINYAIRFDTDGRITDYDVQSGVNNTRSVMHLEYEGENLARTVTDSYKTWNGPDDFVLNDEDKGVTVEYEYEYGDYKVTAEDD